MRSTWFRPMVLGSLLAVALAAGVAVAALAGGGGSPPPGTHTLVNTSARATFGKPSGLPGDGGYVSVFRGLTYFEPADADDAAGTLTRTTTVNLGFTSGKTTTYGCFVLGPAHAADFIVADDLRSASLNTTFDASDACSGAPRAVTGSGPVALGGGGGGGSFAFPLTVDVRWTWLGVVGTSHSEGRTECGDYSLDSQVESSTAGARAVATITAGGLPVLSSAKSVSGALNHGTTTVDVVGAPLPACFGL